MKITDLNPDVLVAVHGYAGDRKQMEELLPVYEHHERPIVFLTPTDSQVHGISMHICRTAGRRAYIGQLSWDRQHDQLKLLLEYNHAWYLLNDSDSFVITPKLPDYLFEDENVVYSNQVDDFRKPGETFNDRGTIVGPWPKDYHAGFPLIAMQPPYFLHRSALEKIVKNSEGLKACPITPFIDWWWVPACHKAHVKHKPFRHGASCETVTSHGEAVMTQCIRERGATFIHSVKSGAVKDRLMAAYEARFSSK